MPKKIAKRKVSVKHKRTISSNRQVRGVAKGESNREFLVGLLIFILIGISVTGTILGAKSGAIPGFNGKSTPPPVIHHDTVTLSLGQSKGVNWYPLEKWQTKDGYNWAGIESDVKDMQNAGISWARFSIVDDNATNDKLIKLLSEHEIRILAIIPPNPPRTKGGFFQRLFYRDTVKKQAQHFGEKVQYYEIGNEPNSPEFWDIDTAENSDDTKYEKSVSDYVEHLKETVTAIKAGNPNAFIFLGGLSDKHVDRWLDIFISKNAYTYIDGVSFHVKASSPAEIGQKVHALKVELAKVADFAVKPLWITDFGFTTDRKDTTGAKVQDEKTKADYVLQGFSAIRNEGLHGPIFWTKLAEDESDKPGYGLVMKNTTTLKTTYLPAYEMLKSF